MYTSGSQTFSHRVPFVGPTLSPGTTLLQESSIYQISCDQNFGKPELIHMPGMPCRSREAPELGILPGAEARIKKQELEPKLSLKFRTVAEDMAFERYI